MPDIIIVEDNKEIGTLLCDFLRKENYRVSLADTGEKALSIFRRMMKSASGWQSRILRTASMMHIQENNKLWQELLYSKIKIKEA